MTLTELKELQDLIKVLRNEAKRLDTEVRAYGRYAGQSVIQHPNPEINNTWGGDEGWVRKCHFQGKRDGLREAAIHLSTLVRKFKEQ